MKTEEVVASLPLDPAPDEIYLNDEEWEKLKRRLGKNQAAILAEVEKGIAESERNRPPLEERMKFLEYVKRMHAMEPLTPGPFPTAEEMIREDRDR